VKIRGAKRGDLRWKIKGNLRWKNRTSDYLQRPVAANDRCWRTRGGREGGGQGEERERERETDRQRKRETRLRRRRLKGYVMLLTTSDSSE
jgi:hypothetical protein